MSISTRRILATATVLGAIAIVPSTASAATISNDAGVLTYTGAPGGSSDVTFESFPSGSDTVFINQFGDDTDPIAPAGCSNFAGGPTIRCDGVTRVVVNAGDGSDQISGFLLTVPLTVDGGPGDDSLFGGSVDDTLDGGPGDDQMIGNGGADDLHGGSGIDFVFESQGLDPADPPVSATLDDRADDGSGEGDNVHSDVEDVTAEANSTPTPGGQPVTLTGSAGPNVLTATGGRAILDGGPGNDVLSGERLDDRITSRDGFADRVRCGDGVDTVIADSLDTISPTCENVDVADPTPAAPVPAPQPPAPAQPAAPPARTTPRLSLAVTPGRDRTAPFRFRATGALALPAGTAKAACTPGRVIVRVTSGAKTVAARTADLKANCTFSARLELSRRTRRGALKVTATFVGNALLSPATSGTRTVRVR